MASPAEAREILEALGLPPAQRNEAAGLALLAFSGLGPGDAWRRASASRLRVHDVLEFIGSHHDRWYRENSRETFGKDILKHWVLAAILAHNPDDPSLPTNSPKNHYALTPEVLAVIRAFGTESFAASVAEFLKATEGGLAVKYAQPRRFASVPVRLPDGSVVRLSPGAHNTLQKGIVEEFLPRFAPTAVLLYLGDTADKDLIRDERTLRQLGIELVDSGQLPDVIAQDPARDWLFLFEAVAVRGPVTPQRKLQLENLFEASGLKRVYVSAFPSFRLYKRYMTEIAWETEVWIAEAPDHLLHHDGEHFISPTG